MSQDKYDPRKPLSEHSREDIEKVWGKNAIPGAQQRLYIENRPLHDSLRLGAVAYGILEPARGTPVPYTKNYEPPAKHPTENEVSLRGEYSKKEIKEFFDNAKASSALFNSDRNEYERRREAGVLFGTFDPREPRYVPTKPVEEHPEWTLAISDELADATGTKRGTVVNEKELERLCLQKAVREREAQEALDAKAKADAETAKLTEAQRLEKAERDRKQNDLDDLVRKVVPNQGL
jgi:hypothetical protein